MISYAILIGSIAVGSIAAFITGGGVEDLANTVTDLAKSPSLLTLFFKFLIPFLIWFTFLGFFHTVRWTYTFECHRKRVNKLVELIAPGSAFEVVWKDLNMEIRSMELFPNPRKIWKSLKKLRKFREEFGEVFRTRYWFPALYFVMLILFVIVFRGFFQYWAIGWLGVAVWLGIAFLCSEPK
jgi:hypothetical protein